MLTRRFRASVCGLVLVALLAACSEDKAAEPDGSPSPSSGRGSVVDLTILQMNDVYELTPVSGGTEGGLARVATLRANLRAENPNTFTILAGDLLNPSALSTAMVDGQRLAGRQMVDVMNILGLDYATFGNHEFDLSQEALLQRLAESKFTWVSSNVAQAGGQAFPNVPANATFTVRNAGGKEVRVGLFGLTVASNAATYVTYRDPVEVAKEQVTALRGQVDILDRGHPPQPRRRHRPRPAGARDRLRPRRPRAREHRGRAGRRLHARGQGRRQRPVRLRPPPELRHGQPRRSTTSRRCSG